MELLGLFGQFLLVQSGQVGEGLDPLGQEGPLLGLKLLLRFLDLSLLVLLQKNTEIHTIHFKIHNGSLK